MKTTLIKGGTIVNEGMVMLSDVRIKEGRISEIGKNLLAEINETVINATGKHLLPGLIDDQVHFRQPGLTYKGDIASESRAAAAGGITTYMEMPNTVPQTLDQVLLEDKYAIGAQDSRVNYSFYMGVSNENLNEVLKTDFSRVCGLKIFMGSSTGDMLVDSDEVLSTIFKEAHGLIATHCEDEPTVRQGITDAMQRYGENIPMSAHPTIRSHEACYRSSSKAIELATKYDARLHVLHISTARELSLFSVEETTAAKRITAEACIHHLWFTDEDYDKRGSRIKWNPAVKSATDRAALREALNTDRIDVLATDHAPHAWEEKQSPYLSCPSGGPLVQHALVAMIELYHQGVLSLETIVRKACHMPAEIYQVKERGYIREGYHADLVLVDLNDAWKVTSENILYKCGWSPFEGDEFKAKVLSTWVNGEMVYDKGQVNDTIRGERIEFTR